MKTLKKILLIPLFAIVCMFVRIDSACAETVPGVTYPFSLTTSSIAANGKFQFKLSAQGTFYVDCGDGGTLSSANGTITRTGTSTGTYTCTYSTAGTKTIQFGGAATGYNTTNTTAAIRFNISDSSSSDSNAALISSISGDLSAVFPYLGSSSGQYPHFYRTFSRARNLGSIPATLFSSITSSGVYTFNHTFEGCTGLTSIPENLFNFGGNNIVAKSGVFASTFYGCTGLTSLPENLFQRVTGVTSSATNLFNKTFYGCTGLTGYIPPSMFSGLIANGSPYASSGTTGMMYQTFNNTGSLATTCPSGTTQYTTGYEDYWDSHVACTAPVTCSSGYYLPAGSETCTTCPSNKTCPGGTFTFNPTKDQGISINLTWYDGNSTISGPTSCAVGGVFLPPTPPARTGYVFNGWKIKPK